MKTLGQIQYESLEIADLENHPWEKLPDWLKHVHERSANIIVQEACQRQRLVEKFPDFPRRESQEQQKTWLDEFKRLLEHVLPKR